MKVFVEQQRFNQWWFRLLAVGVIVMVAWPIFSFSSETSGVNTDFWIVLLISIFTIILFVWMLFFLKLETKIDEQGIYYGFWPFNLKLKHIPWSDIKSVVVRKYNPVTEYGGWGYRMGFGAKSGAINVKGNIGIQIVLRDNKKLLLGTQKENDARNVLQTYSHKIASS